MEALRLESQYRAKGLGKHNQRNVSRERERGSLVFGHIGYRCQQLWLEEQVVFICRDIIVHRARGDDHAGYSTLLARCPYHEGKEQQRED